MAQSSQLHDAELLAMFDVSPCQILLSRDQVSRYLASKAAASDAKNTTAKITGHRPGPKSRTSIFFQPDKQSAPHTDESNHNLIENSKVNNCASTKCNISKNSKSEPINCEQNTNISETIVGSRCNLKASKINNYVVQAHKKNNKQDLTSSKIDDMKDKEATIVHNNVTNNVSSENEVEVESRKRGSQVKIVASDHVDSSINVKDNMLNKTFKIKRPRVDDNNDKEKIVTKSKILDCNTTNLVTETKHAQNSEICDESVKFNFSSNSNNPTSKTSNYSYLSCPSTGMSEEMLHIHAIAHKLESYFNSNETFPMCSNSNDVEFLTDNETCSLSGLDDIVGLEIGDIMTDSSSNSIKDTEDNETSFIEIAIKNNSDNKSTLSNNDVELASVVSSNKAVITTNKIEKDNTVPVNRIVNEIKYIKPETINHVSVNIDVKKHPSEQSNSDSVNKLANNNELKSMNNTSLQKSTEIENKPTGNNLLKTESKINSFQNKVDIENSNKNQIIAEISEQTQINQLQNECKIDSIEKDDNIKKLYKFDGVKDLVTYLSTCKSTPSNYPLLENSLIENSLNSTNIAQTSNTVKDNSLPILKSCCMTVTNVDDNKKKIVKQLEGNKCLKCGQFYTSKYLFKNHSCIRYSQHSYNNNVESKSKSSSYICKCCSLSFLFLDTLNYHYKYAHGIDTDLIDKIILTCQFCQKHFISKKSLELHLTVEHFFNEDLPHFNINSVQFKCKICREAFNTGSEFINHNINHEETPQINHTSLIEDQVQTDNIISSEEIYQLSCTSNNLEIDQTNQDSNQSNATETSQNSNMTTSELFSCKICNTYYRDRQKLAEHFKQCSITEIITKSKKCTFCKELFLSESEMNIHIRTYHFMCVVCCTRFKSTSTLFKHEKNHIMGNIYFLQCPHCKLDFKNTKELCEHGKKIHQKVIIPSNCIRNVKQINDDTTCLFCCLKFDSSEDLTLHLQDLHHVCSICFDIFPNHNRLITHESKHLLYQCPCCPLTFTQPFDIYMHCSRTHDITIKPSSCKIDNIKREVSHTSNIPTSNTSNDTDNSDIVNPEVSSITTTNISDTSKDSQTIIHSNNSNINIYVCIYCDLEFESQELLQNHSLQIHDMSLCVSCHKFCVYSDDSTVCEECCNNDLIILEDYN